MALALAFAHLPLAAAAQDAPATVEGVVFDSLRGRPLAGAVVTIGDLPRQFVTDSAGRFRATGLSPGPSQATFRHAVLDSLGIRAPAIPVALQPGDTVRIDLGPPSGQALLAHLCRAAPAPGPAPPDESPSGLLGVVRDVENDAPVPGATVRLRWRSTVIDPALGIRRKMEMKDASTDASGLYVLCGVPGDLEASLVAMAAGFDTASAEATLPANALGVQHFHLAHAGGDAVATATLSGTVRDEAGAPLEAAEVVPINRWGVATKPPARTDGRGGFTLSGLRAGTQVVAIKRVGSVPVRRTVTLAPDRTTTVAVTLAARAVQLADVTVEGERTADQRGFTQRRRIGNGQFYDRSDIARRNVVQSSDLVRQMPGMKVEQGRGGLTITNESLRRNMTGSTCAMSTFLDGVPAPADFVLNIPVEEIEAVEVYNTPERVPMEYGGERVACGAMLFWTSRSARR